MTRDANSVWARAIVDELARSGVREVCVAPGSRSTPLVLAVAAHDRLRAFVHLDERSAAFFALGVAKATGRAAAVVTTSGTAVANLLPAVVEASQSEAPLVLLTADRPPGLRGTDANQTIDQPGIFGGYTRAALDLEMPRVEDEALRRLRSQVCGAVAAARGVPSGPAHLNVPFDKPLEPDPGSDDTPPGFEEEFPLAWSGRPDGSAFVFDPDRGVPPRDADVAAALGYLTEAAGRVLVVAGPTPEPGVGRAAAELCRVTGWPLVADPLSGGRYPLSGSDPGAGPDPGSDPSVRGTGRRDGGRSARGSVLTRYDLFLRAAGLRDELRPGMVLRVGAAPTSAVFQDVMAEWSRSDAAPFHLVVDAGHRRKDHQGLADWYLQADAGTLLALLAEEVAAGSVELSPDLDWVNRWQDAEAATNDALRKELRGPLVEGAVLAAAVAAAPAGAHLFVGSSMPVRDLDAFGGGRGAALYAVGNRGASGIDGSVSTAAGMAAALHPDSIGGLAGPPRGEGPGGRDASGVVPVVAVLGDIAFHHDMNGLLGASAHNLPVLFVVINNDGGGIFHMLPIREHEPEFARFFATPHGLDFRHAAELYGIPYTLLDPAGDDPLAKLEELLARALERIVEEGGPRIVEVRTDREANRRRREEVVAAVRAAVTVRMQG